CHVIPSFSSIFCHMNRSVISPYPNYSFLYRRLVDIIYGAIILFTGYISCDRTTRNHLFGGVIGSKIWRDSLPCYSVIRGPMDKLWSMVDYIGIVGGNMDGRYSLKAIGEVFGVMAVYIGCPYIKLLLLPCTFVIYPKAALAIGINNIVVAGFWY